MVIALPRNNDLNDAQVAISRRKRNKNSHMKFKHHPSTPLRQIELSEAPTIRGCHLESRSKDFLGDVQAEDELTLNREELSLQGSFPISTPVFNLNRHSIPVSFGAAILCEDALRRKEETGVAVTPEKREKSTISCEVAFDREAETRVVVSPCNTTDNDPSKVFPEFVKSGKQINKKRSYDTEQGHTSGGRKRASKEETTVAKHTYRDFSCSLRVQTKCKPKDNIMRLYPGAQFPEKVHYMLEKSSRAGLSNIFAWKSHGRAFCVNDTKAFANLILPGYFHHSKWASFLRQLNLYGFKRINRGPDIGSYYHELFLRGFSKLSRDMETTRFKVVGKTVSNPEEEPDFYSMPKIGMDHTLTNKENKNNVKKANIDKPRNVCRDVVAMKRNKKCKGKRKYSPKYFKDGDTIKCVAQSATMNHSSTLLQSELSAPALCGLQHESKIKDFFTAMQLEDEAILKEFSNLDYLNLNGELIPMIPGSFEAATSYEPALNQRTETGIKVSHGATVKPAARKYVAKHDNVYMNPNPVCEDSTYDTMVVNSESAMPVYFRDNFLSSHILDELDLTEINLAPDDVDEMFMQCIQEPNPYCDL